MLKTIFSTVMWVGRGTVFLVGLVVMLALLLGAAATAAEAAKAKSLKRGIANTVGAVTTMVGPVVGPILNLENTSTDASATGLNLQVHSGNAPLTVAPGAGTATNLDADKLDGKDSNDFKISCPPETQLFSGACIEEEARTASTFLIANTTCATGSRRLPTSAELNAFRQQPQIELENSEFTSDFVSDTLVLIMDDGGNRQEAAVTFTAPYRCVASASN